MSIRTITFCQSKFTTQYLRVIPSIIPQYLISENQWIVWKPIDRRGKTTKPPYDAKTGMIAHVNDPSTWSDFNTVLSAYHRGGWAGIGFILTDNLGLVGWDFDHCIDQTGAIAPEVQRFINILSTYTEKSPSGTGIRAFAFGRLPPEGRKRGPYECYSGGRYLTITGARIGAYGIKRRKEEIVTVHRSIFPPPTMNATQPAANAQRGYQPPTDIQSLLERAFKSRCGPEIERLYKGAWDGVTGCPSQSEADLKLCRHLAFWLERDPGAIDHAFRGSGLYRDKWQKSIGGATYGQRTIEKAIALTVKIYGVK